MFLAIFYDEDVLQENNAHNRLLPEMFIKVDQIKKLEFGDYMDVSEDIAIDNEGYVYVTGWASAPNFPATDTIL